MCLIKDYPPQVSAVLLDRKIVLEQDPTVAQSTNNSSSLSARSILSKRFIERDGAYAFQRIPFVPELNFISQPPNILLDQLSNYKFPASGGEAVDVYVPDSGCNVNNEDLVTMRGRYRWLEPPAGTWPEVEPWTPTDSSGHGTCMADKVAGYNYGVAKNANLVLLRIPIDDDDDVFNSGMLLVFEMIITDIDARRQAGYSKLPVVSISWMTRDLSEDFKEILLRAISNLLSRGTVLVILSGNDAVSFLPRGFAYLLERS